MAGRPDPAFLNNVPTDSPISPSTSSPSPSSSSTSTSSSSSTSASLSSTISPSSSTLSTSTATSTISSPTTTPEPGDGPISVYAYVPSASVAVVFATLYGILLSYHFYLSIYNPQIRKSVAQKHTYTIPLFIACVCYCIGFAIRVISVMPSNRGSVLLFALSQTFIIVAPIFVCATLYLVISHLITLCLPHGKDRRFLRISPRLLGRLFIVSDVSSFFLQGAGSALAATTGPGDESRRDTGLNVLIFGLAAQLATFTLYLAVLILFCRRVQAGSRIYREDEHKYDTGNNMTKRDFGFNPLVKQVVKGVWIASALVQIRNIYRVVQFSVGTEGYLYRHEWTLWTFDASPMWLALLVLGIYHPTKWLQSKRRSWFIEKTTRPGT